MGKFIRSTNYEKVLNKAVESKRDCIVSMCGNKMAFWKFGSIHKTKFDSNETVYCSNGFTFESSIIKFMWENGSVLEIRL
jgi:hypothetical protein